MKITNLKQQLKNPERVSIFVDEKYSFSLSLDQLVEHKLKKGLELSEADIKKFKKISTDGKTKARALEWVINRPHSTREFKDYMRRKKADDDLTEKLIQEFTAKKYLNDEHYARWLIELRSRSNKSNRAIKSELIQKGVGREVVDNLFETDANDESARLKELIRKKQKISKYAEDQTKLIRYLTSKGFSYQQVKQQLDLDIPEESA